MSGRTSTATARRSRRESGRPAGGGAGTAGGTAAPVATRGPAQSDAPVPALPSHNRGTAMADEWPLRDFIEFGALPGAVPCARLHARLVLAEWGLTALSEPVELTVSELVTNSVAASYSLEHISPVRIWLLADKARVLILVWDRSPQPPVRINTDGDAESGRGLLLVETISARWGFYATTQMGGKAVWALIEET